MRDNRVEPRARLQIDVLNWDVQPPVPSVNFHPRYSAMMTGVARYDWKKVVASGAELSAGYGSCQHAGLEGWGNGVLLTKREL